MHIAEQLQGLDGKLSPGNTLLIKALLRQPEPHLWHSAKNMIIGNRPIVTLSKAVRCVMHTAHIPLNTTSQTSETALELVPDPFTIYRALRYCISKQQVYRYRLDVCDSES